jgi:hypothetical protein
VFDVFDVFDAFDAFDVFDVCDVPQVVNNSALSTLAGVLLALELRGAHTYYQVSSSDKVYPPQYQANKCVGILWTHLAQRQTWFGAAVYFGARHSAVAGHARQRSAAARGVDCRRIARFL